MMWIDIVFTIHKLPKKLGLNLENEIKKSMLFLLDSESPIWPILKTWHFVYSGKIGHHKIGASAEIGQNRIRGGWGVKKTQKTSDIIYVRSLSPYFCFDI